MHRKQKNLFTFAFYFCPTTVSLSKVFIATGTTKKVNIDNLLFHYVMKRGGSVSIDISLVFPKGISTYKSQF